MVSYWVKHGALQQGKQRDSNNVTTVRTEGQNPVRKGPFKCYVTLFSGNLIKPHNANNVEPYIFVTLFSGKSDTLPLRTTLRNTWMAPRHVFQP